jgi:hypothetical protein
MCYFFGVIIVCCCRDVLELCNPGWGGREVFVVACCCRVFGSHFSGCINARNLRCSPLLSQIVANRSVLLWPLLRSSQIVMFALPRALARASLGT